MLKLAFRYIKREKKNTAICIAGIAVSVMLLFSLVQIGELILVEYREQLLSLSWAHDVHIESLDQKTADEIYKKYEEQYTLAEEISFAYTAEKTGLPARVSGMRGSNFLAAYKMEMLEGTVPADKSEICLSQAFARERGLQVGDTVTLPMAIIELGIEVTEDFTVSGISTDPVWYEASAFLLVTQERAEEILKDAGVKEVPWYADYILMNENGFPDDEEVTAMTLYLFDTYGKDIMKKIFFSERKQQLREDGVFYTGISAVIWGVIAFIAVVMAIFIYYMMCLNFQSKMGQYGTMRALGAGNKAIGRMILGELFLYGCGGIVPGCLGGILFNKAFAGFFIRIFVGSKVEQITVSWQMLLWVVGITAAVMLTVWFKLMLELKKKTPVEMLHDTGHVVKKKIFTCKNSLTEMAVNNSFRDKRSARALLTTMTLAFLAVILVGNGLDSVPFELGDTPYAFSDFDVSIPMSLELLMGEVRMEEADRQTLETCADKVYLQGYMPEYAPYTESGEQLGRICIYSRNLMEKLISMQHLPKDTRVVFSGSDEEDLQGARIFLKNDAGGVIPVTVDVVMDNDNRFEALLGVGTTSNTNLIIEEGYAKELFGQEPQWVEAFVSGKDLTITDLQDVLPSGRYIVTDLANIFGYAVTQIQMIIILLGYMMVALTGLVAFMITSIVRQNFEHRKKEIGMMRAVGATRRKLEGMLWGEVFVLVALAGIAAAALAAPISAYAYYCMNEETGMGTGGYLAGGPAVLLFCGAVIYGNIRKCMKGNIIRLLRSEE